MGRKAIKAARDHIAAGDRKPRIQPGNTDTTISSPYMSNVASAGSVLDLYLLIELIKVKDILIFLLLLNI